MADFVHEDSDRFTVQGEDKKMKFNLTNGKGKVSRRKFLASSTALATAVGVLSGVGTAQQGQESARSVSDSSKSDPGPTNAVLDAQNPSGLSRSKHYQTPHLVIEAVLAQSIAFEHQQCRCAAFAVTNSLRQATSSVVPPVTDAGSVPAFKYPFSLSHKRLHSGGWSREVTVRELPVSKSIAGVDMRLTAGGIRELHWHAAAEWAFMLYGSARITAIDATAEVSWQT
jgi:Cupin